MLKDITLGQYFPGNSVVHRLDPRTKLILLVGYIVALFMASGFVSYGILLLFFITCIAVSTIPAKAFLRGMKPLVFILVFCMVMLFFLSTLNPTSVNVALLPSSIMLLFLNPIP